MTPPTDAALERFRTTGDLASLRDHARRMGEDAARFETALRLLTPVFEPLSHGEHPRLHDLDLEALQAHAPEVGFIIDCMAGSPKSDLSEAAAQLRHWLALAR